MVENIKSRPRLNRTRGRALYMTFLIPGMALCIPLNAGAAVIDHESLEGTHGRLYVMGGLAESACRLEMESANQTVTLGEIGTGRLTQVGQRGVAVRFTLTLVDCLSSSSGSWDGRLGGLTWGRHQPAVTVQFNAASDADNPQLLKVKGVSGMGLRMLDSEGRDVRLGERGAPLGLIPGQNTLSYTVAPERTVARLIPGEYRVVVDFHLHYD